MINIASLHNMDPALYEQMQPFVQQAVSRYGRGRNLTAADINRMADEVVAGSRYNLYSPMAYGQTNLNEIARFLILISLYNTYGYNLNPYWQLYYGGIPNFLLPYLIMGRPPYANIPWRRHSGRGPSPMPIGRGPSRSPIGRGPAQPPLVGGASRPGSNRSPSRQAIGGGASRPGSNRGPSRQAIGGGASRPGANRGPSRQAIGGGPFRPSFGRG